MHHLRSRMLNKVQLLSCTVVNTLYLSPDDLQGGHDVLSCLLLKLSTHKRLHTETSEPQQHAQADWDNVESERAEITQYCCCLEVNCSPLGY